MRREAILHIGPMKTGSTSIQGWLRRNRDTLARSGFHVPSRPGMANLSRMGRVAHASAHGKPIEDPAVTEFWKRLTEEFSELPQSARSVVISGELMGQRLREPSEVAALKTLLSPWFDRFRVIVYLRRQDEVSVSLFSTRVRNRSTPDEALLSDPVDYAALLATWGAVFGRAAMMPRLFDRTDLVGGDVIADFADAIGVPGGSVSLEAPVKNQSLTPAAQDFFRRVYDAAGGDGNRHDFAPGNHTRARRTVSQEFSGSGRLPTRAEAAEFMASVEASNERVRAEWFPTRARLFSDDFSRYPIEARAEPPADELLDVAFSVISTLLSRTVPRRREADGLGEPGGAEDGSPVAQRSRRREHRERRGKGGRSRPPRVEGGGVPEASALDDGARFRDTDAA